MALSRQLDDAQERLSAVKAARPSSSSSDGRDGQVQQQLQAAERQVVDAAAAAREASEQLQLVLREKQQVQTELADVKRQLEEQPPGRQQQHAELHLRLVVSVPARMCCQVRACQRWRWPCSCCMLHVSVMHQACILTTVVLLRAPCVALQEAQRTLADEKEAHQRLTSSLLEHAGRLSHQYHVLAGDHASLQHK